MHHLLVLVCHQVQNLADGLHSLQPLVQQKTFFFFSQAFNSFNEVNSIIYFNKVVRLHEGETTNIRFQCNNIKIKQALQQPSTYIPGNLYLIFSSNAILLFIYGFI